jgi:hypothetical protein
MAKGKAKNTGGEPPLQLDFEAELFKAADKLRGNIEPGDYNHVALGLIFLKYIFDALETRHGELQAEDPQAAEDEHEYRPNNFFWVPKEGRVYDPCHKSVGRLHGRCDRQGSYRPLSAAHTDAATGSTGGGGGAGGVAPQRSGRVCHRADHRRRWRPQRLRPGSMR